MKMPSAKRLEASIGLGSLGLYQLNAERMAMRQGRASVGAHLWIASPMHRWYLQ
jgi:hypothetical protein